MTFSISALVSARDSHIKPDSEAGGLIPIRCGTFHVTIYLSHVWHWLFFQALTFIFELTNCENKSLREMHLFKYFCFESGFKKISNNVDLYNDVRECLSKIYPRRWHLNGISVYTYIWANYSVSIYLNFIPIFWNMLIWLNYDFML